jgi:hypothetical protein
MTRNCQCRIRDVACLGWYKNINISGNVVGYHVTLPCDVCMNSCNNGHLWMFLSDAVQAQDRKDKSGSNIINIR